MWNPQPCPYCGHEATVSLSSLDKRICNQCKRYFDWPLKPGKKSILQEGKKGERTV